MNLVGGWAADWVWAEWSSGLWTKAGGLLLLLRAPHPLCTAISASVLGDPWGRKVLRDMARSGTLRNCFMHT